MEDNRIKVVEISDYILNLWKLLNEEKINYQPIIGYTPLWNRIFFLMKGYKWI